MNSYFEHIEASLLKDMSQAASGDGAAMERLCNAFRLIEGPQDKGFIPVLRAAMRIPNDEMQISAITGLGRIGVPVPDAVPQLLQFIRGTDQGLMLPAALALTYFPGYLSVEGMVEAFEKVQPPADKWEIARHLTAHGPDVAPYLSRLYAAASSYTGQEYERLMYVLRELGDTVRYYEMQSLSNVSFHFRIPLCPTDFEGRVDEYYSDYRIVLKKPYALVYNDRFRYSLSEDSLVAEFHAVKDSSDILEPKEAADRARRELSDINIRIYRRLNGENFHIVVFTADKDWFGTSPHLVIERLSTAAIHIFGLDPKRTLFVENWTQGSGIVVFGEAETYEVKMDYDPETMTFRNPKWVSLFCLYTFLIKNNVHRGIRNR